MPEDKVLIVDDEEELVQSLIERLAYRGVSGEGVMDAESALDRLAGGGIDVVVLDLMMPGMGGRWLIERIRERYPGLPVLLITGHGATSDEEEDVYAGIHDLLLKPFDIEELVEKIKSCRRS